MASLLYFFSGVILTNYVINGKSISIKIDSDDVLKLMGGLMNSDVFKDFATQVFQRNLVKRYNNPFHPEDDLVAQFDDTIMKEHEKLKSTKNNSVEKIDVLDKENEKFDDGGLNEEIDVLTDNEINENDKPNIYPVLKEQQAVAVIQYKNYDTTSTTKTTANVLVPLENRVLNRDDRFNFRPNQKRFVMQSRKDQL